MPPRPFKNIYMNSLEVANSISAEEVDAFAREVMREDRKVVSTVMPA